MLSSVEQAFVGREEIRAPLKTPAWEATWLLDVHAAVLPWAVGCGLGLGLGLG